MAPVAEPVARRPVDAAETRSANRSWWDRAAAGYQAEHGDFLRDAGFRWCPEGLTEDEAGLLGPVAGRRVLEVGCGAAQCSRWLLRRDARAAAVDLSAAQLAESRRLDLRTGTPVPSAVADALALPVATGSMDIAFSAYGAVQFVADAAALHREVARVLAAGGRWVFAVSHPVRWAFPDDPDEPGLRATTSYFDRRPYVEQDASGRARYVEHHRTLGDQVRALAAAGFRLTDLVEPEWPPGHRRVWGGWSPLRGRLIPGTAIFVNVLEDRLPDQ